MSELRHYLTVAEKHQNLYDDPSYLEAKQYCDDVLTKKMTKSTFNTLVELSEKNSYAQLRLATVYKFGYITDSKKEMLELYTKSANTNAHAMNELGVISKKAKDFSKAIDWFKLSASYKNRYALFNLGNMHYFGDGVEQDYKTAFQLLERAAICGHRQAQFDVATMLESGIGTDKDEAKSFEWYELSARQNYRDAQYNFAYIYDNATHGFTEPDYVTARKWYLKASKNKDSDACFRLGEMYEEGLGVAVNYEKAMKHYKKAAEYRDSN
jgi:TPR repeat protein